MDYACRCSNSKSKDEVVNCVVHSLKTIKNHILTLVKESKERDREIAVLKERNLKLQKSLNLYQQQGNGVNENNLSGCDLKHKAPPKNEDNTDFHDDRVGYAFIKNWSPSLDAALNEAQIDVTTICPTQDESIEETEKFTSPRKRKDFGTRLLSLKKRNCENESNNAQQTLKSRKGNELKKSTTETSNLAIAKTRQSLLPCEVLQNHQKRRNKQPDALVFNETPNLYTEITAAKHQRIMMLSDMKRALDAQASGSGLQNKQMRTPEKTLKAIDDFEFVLQNSPLLQNLEKPKRKPLTPVKLPTEFEKSQSPSVMYIPPQTPEVIFIDDSFDGQDAIQTPDLVAEMLNVNQDKAIGNLKRMETNAIEQQKKMYEQLNKILAATTENVVIEPIKKIKKEVNTPNISVDPLNDSTFLCEDDYLSNKNEVLHEVPVSQASPGDIPRPIIVKEEKVETKIYCEKCTNYLNFFGGIANSVIVKELLKNCKTCNKPDPYMQETPVNFWNPLMESFSEGDPRNETLIENRIPTIKKQ